MRTVAEDHIVQSQANHAENIRHANHSIQIFPFKKQEEEKNPTFSDRIFPIGEYDTVGLPLQW